MSCERCHADPFDEDPWELFQIDGAELDTAPHQHAALGHCRACGQRVLHYNTGYWESDQDPGNLDFSDDWSFWVPASEDELRELQLARSEDARVANRAVIDFVLGRRRLVMDLRNRLFWTDRSWEAPLGRLEG